MFDYIITKHWGYNYICIINDAANYHKATSIAYSGRLSSSNIKFFSLWFMACNELNPYPIRIINDVFQLKNDFPRMYYFLLKNLDIIKRAPYESICIYEYDFEKRIRPYLMPYRQHP